MDTVLRTLLLSVLLTGCAPPPDDIIRFALAGQVQSLDPRFATDAVSARVNRLLYQRLVDFDARQRPVASLADWRMLSPRHYRFVLRAGRADFHDGSPVTAQDVAATYRSIIAPGSGSPHAGTLRMIDTVEVIDPDTVDFHLHRPEPLFPGYAVIGILPASLVARDRPVEREPVGSGAFRLVSWPAPGRVRLERVADGQMVEFMRIADPTVRVLKLLRGEVDLLQNDLPTELVQYLADQNGVVVKQAPGNNFAYLGFNMADPALADRRVRLAVAHAIDREAVIEHLFGGAARTAEALLPPEHWAGEGGLAAYPFDIAQARHLLATAGYGPDRPLRLEYKTTTDPVRLRIATVLQQQLGKAGIELRLRSYDWGTFFADIKGGRFQLYSLMWVGIKTPDIFRYAFHSASLPPEGANRGRYVDDALDRLLARAEAAPDIDSQARHWHAIQRHLHEQLPYIPLWFEDHVVAYRAGIHDYRLAVDGNYDSLVDVRKETE